MKRLSILLVTAILVIGSLAAPVFAQNEAGVTVTVQVAQLSVSVDMAEVDYGLVNLNTCNLTPIQPWEDPVITARNTSNCWVTMNIKGDDTDDWTLDDTEPVEPGDEVYTHYFGIGPEGSVYYDYLAHGYKDLGPWASMSPGCPQGFRLQMCPPVSSAASGMQTTSVMVQIEQCDFEGITLQLATDEESYEQGTGPAVLTANVTDNVSAPVTGLTDFLTIIHGYPPQEVTFTETASGIYTGDLDISTLDPGSYTVEVSTHDGAWNGATSKADFDILLAP